MSLRLPSAGQFPAARSPNLSPKARGPLIRLIGPRDSTATGGHLEAPRSRAAAAEEP